MPTKQMTTQDFKDLVFDFSGTEDWKHKGTLPVIIDFYADWCGPCKMVAPMLEELAKEYEGRLEVFKVDTEKELELSSVFGIRSIPTFLFIPVEGDPVMESGALPRHMFKQIIEEQLLSNNAPAAE